ncbi:hypothetical protein ACLMJK_000269 [Lecanora helva]
MAIQGQRFDLNFGDEHEDVQHSQLKAGFNIGLVQDITERTISTDSKPPLPPQLKSPESGFPAHKVRTGSSRFRGKREDRSNETNLAGKRQSESPIHVVPSATANQDATTTLKDPSIDEENKQRLAEMSDQEIEEAKQEIMNGLSPSLIERLLKRADIDESHNVDTQAAHKELNERATQQNKRVTFRGPDSQTSSTQEKQDKTVIWDPDGPPLHPPPDLHPASSYPSSLPRPPNIHFPNPPLAPDLDPSDPDFLAVLHSTYFPNLPADPSTMSWMTPVNTKSVEETSCSPLQGTHPVSALRFDFRGHLLPPRLSAQIPSTKGLHHHAHAPSAAGYTVPELSHLARSTYPAQRCIAYQTLGRILYRLGRGDFGQEGEDLCEGLWQQMEQGKVVDQLVGAAAKGDSGNKSIWVTATEAVWLWRKGGGRRWRGR